MLPAKSHSHSNSSLIMASLPAGQGKEEVSVEGLRLGDAPSEAPAAAPADSYVAEPWNTSDSEDDVRSEPLYMNEANFLDELGGHANYANHDVVQALLKTQRKHRELSTVPADSEASGSGPSPPEPNPYVNTIVENGAARPLSVILSTAPAALAADAQAHADDPLPPIAPQAPAKQLGPQLPRDDHRTALM